MGLWCVVVVCCRMEVVQVICRRCLAVLSALVRKVLVHLLRTSVNIHLRMDHLHPSHHHHRLVLLLDQHSMTTVMVCSQPSAFLSVACRNAVFGTVYSPVARFTKKILGKILSLS